MRKQLNIWVKCYVHIYLSKDENSGLMSVPMKMAHERCILKKYKILNSRSCSLNIRMFFIEQKYTILCIGGLDFKTKNRGQKT